MPTLGVVIFSLQGMKHLAQCLHSVRWADEVRVVHFGDGEPSMGENPSSSVVVKRLPPADTKGGLRQKMSTDWVLYLWGEERVEAELTEELRALRRGGLLGAPGGYRIPIRSQVLGHWVEGSVWGPNPALRLSREVGEFSLGWWHVLQGDHTRGTGLLGGWIGDYSVAELSDGVDRLDSISGLWAQHLRARGWNPTLRAVAVEPLRVFIRLLVRSGFFSNGLAGLTLPILAAYAMLLSAAKVWEAQNVKSTE